MSIKITNNVNQDEVARLKGEKELFVNAAGTLAAIQTDIDALPTATESERIEIISRCLSRQAKIINILAQR